MNIAIDRISESKSNPRTRFDQAGMDELTASVKEHGILEPVLTREVNGHYELVYGHRRVRAAIAAGLEEIPANVRELTDAQVLEIQLIENLQRADLHPLEEAEGYQRLMKLKKYTADDMAVKIGKSRAYVYARLKLSELPEAVKKQFWEDKVNPSVALLIARIPDAKLAEEAAEEVMTSYNGEPMSVREAAEHIQTEYMLRLSSAPFKTNDAELLPKAGACNVCQKRTGNQAVLFADIKSADVCTDVTCFRQKQEAAGAALIAEAKAAGHTVIEGKKAEKVFPYPHSHSPAYDSDYVSLSATCYQDSKQRSYQQLLKKHAPAPVLVRHPHDGTVHKMVKKSAIPEALSAAGHEFASQATGPVKSKSQKEAEKKAREKAAIEAEAKRLAMGKMAERVEKGLSQTAAKAIWEITAISAIETCWNDIIIEVAKRRNLLGDKKRSAASQRLLKAVKTMNLLQLQGLVCEIHLTTQGGGKAYEVLKIDLKAITEQVRAGQAKKKASVKKKTPKKKATAKNKKVKKATRSASSKVGGGG